jgi:hypothetical protein
MLLWLRQVQGLDFVSMCYPSVPGGFMRTKILLWGCVGGLLLAVMGWVYNNRLVRLRWDAQYQSTRDAYNRSAEYRDAGTLLYEPRHFDYEKNFDTLSSLPRPYYGDIDYMTRTNMTESLRLCDDYVGMFRDYDRIISDASTRALALGAAQSREGIETTIQHCVADGTVDPTDPAQKMMVDSPQIDSTQTKNTRQAIKKTPGTKPDEKITEAKPDEENPETKPDDVSKLPLCKDVIKPGSASYPSCRFQ